MDLEPNRLRASTPFLVGLVLLLAARSASAQTFRSTPLGGRSTLMGGTGIAAGSDGAAPFLNPANALRVDANLTVAFGTLSFSNLEVKPVYQSGASNPAFGGVDASGRAESQFRIEGVPSVLCVFADPGRLPGSRGERAGSQKLSACFGTIDRQNVQMIGRGFVGDSSLPLSQSLSFTRNWTRFAVSPSYALAISDELAIGITAPVYSTSDQAVAANGAALVNGDVLGTSALQMGLDASSVDFGFAMGVTYRRGPWSVGAVFQTEDAHLYGSGRYSDYRQVTIGTDVGATSRVYKGNFRATAPARAGWGIAYEGQRMALAFDLSVGFPRTHAVQADFHGTTSTGTTSAGHPAEASQHEEDLVLSDDMKTTVTVSVGTEYFTSKSLSVLGGVFANLTDTSTAPILVPVRENRIGLSFGFGSYGDWGKLLFGIQTSYGWGVSLAPNVWQVPPEQGAVSTTAFRALLVIAGDTSFASIKRSVETLVLDPLRAKPEAPPTNDGNGTEGARPSKDLPSP